MLVLLAFSCKNGKGVATQKEAPKKAEEESVIDPKSKDDANDFSRGIVSLELKKNGCAALVKGFTPDGEELVLIPNKPLGNLEKEGQKIKFHFRLLRMPQPEGCTKGVPAELTDLTVDE